MQGHRFVFVIAAALGATACHLDDSDRCDGDFYYAADAGACLPLDTETETESDTGAADGGTDAGADTDEEPTGLGEPCASDTDCAAYDASYCMLLFTPNMCMLPDCTTSPDDCPEGYTCCDVVAAGEAMGVPGSLCVSDEYYGDYATYCESK